MTKLFSNVVLKNITIRNRITVVDRTPHELTVPDIQVFILAFREAAASYTLTDRSKNSMICSLFVFCFLFQLIPLFKNYSGLYSWTFQNNRGFYNYLIYRLPPLKLK